MVWGCGPCAVPWADKSWLVKNGHDLVEMLGERWAPAGLYNANDRLFNAGPRPFRGNAVLNARLFSTNDSFSTQGIEVASTARLSSASQRRRSAIPERPCAMHPAQMHAHFGKPEVCLRDAY